MNFDESLKCEIEKIRNEIIQIEQELNARERKDYDKITYISLFSCIVPLLFGINEMYNGNLINSILLIVNTFIVEFGGLFTTFYLDNKNEKIIKMLNDKKNEKEKTLYNKINELKKITIKYKKNNSCNYKKSKNDNYVNKYSNKKIKVKVKKRI